MTARDPSLTEVLDVVMARRLEGVHTAMPARVERYDATLQVVDVQPLVKAPYIDEAGATQWEALPIVQNVPLVTPGAGGYRITLPVAVGDTVQLQFAECSLDLWQDGQPGIVNPRDGRRFHLSDAVAITGLHSNAQPWHGAATDAMTLGHDAGPGIVLRATGVELGARDGEPATEAAVLGTTYRANESAANAQLIAALTSLNTTLGLILTAFAKLTLSPAIADSSVACGAVAVPGADTIAQISTAIARLNALEGAAASYLATAVKVKAG